MQRSKNVVFVSHCLLNQNVRALGKEMASGSIKDIVEVLNESGVGIVQLPCPQIEFNGGLNWKHDPKKFLENNAYRKSCQNFSKGILKQIKTYMDKGYNISGIIGVELSATCAVHQIEEGTKIKPGKGVLIDELEQEMHKKRFQVPIIGIDLNNLYASAEKLKNLLGV